MAKTYDSLYLIQNKWRAIRKVNGKYGYVHYWTHDNHQPGRHGFFTQTAAINHQRMLDKNGGVCNCIKYVEGE